MKTRCYNSSVGQYKYYGAKGVRVCDEWREDFKAFYDWAEANGYESFLTIDRKDSSGDYCPENCRWITQAENSSGNSNGKLTERDVRIICRSRSKYRVLAKRFGVTSNYIYRIRARERNKKFQL
jgi:hypothetical protein